MTRLKVASALAVALPLSTPAIATGQTPQDGHEKPVPETRLLPDPIVSARDPRWAEMRRKYPLFWAALKCNQAAIKAYGDHWKLVPPDVMRDEVWALKAACMAAVLGKHSRVRHDYVDIAHANYKHVHALDSLFRQPNLEEAYGLKPLT